MMAFQDTPRQTLLDLFHECAPGVYRFALVLLRHPEDAEDVVQETYLKLMGHLDSGGDDTNLKGWLFTVAAHACRDRLRRRTRWVPWSSAREGQVQPAALPDEDGRLRAAQAALQRLSQRDRLLLTLRAHGLSYREIAAAARLRPSSVGRLLARALNRWERAYVEAPPLPHAYGRSSP
jgi:RNA polymerase sigma-70 factor (ECF subfamily)